MCDDKLTAVAVYGTLKHGGHFCREEGIICSSEDKIKGTLYSVDAYAVPFPALKLTGDNLIDVEVHIVNEEQLKYMNRVEGSLYTKRNVITEGGVPVAVYEWNGSTGRLTEISKWEN